VYYNLIICNIYFENIEDSELYGIKNKLEQRGKSFLMQEEEYLKQIVDNKDNLTWNDIAVEMGRKFPDKARTGKQYR